MNSGFNSFGTGSGFNSTGTNLFSSNNQNTLRPSGTGSIFGSSTTQTGLGTPSQPQSGNLFGSSFSGFPSGAQAQQTVGTTIKFVAPSGTDSINKNGSTTQINTNHQCITAMKEYESKSLEELRFEDYQANRKFPTQTSTQFGGSSGLFSSSTTSNTFGSPNLFGSNTQTQANRPLLFGSSSTTTTTTPQTTSLFGQTAQNTTANRSFFSSTAGTTASSTTAGFSGFGQQPTTSVFGAQPATTQQPSTSIFGNIGQTSTTTPTSGSLFGSSSLSSTGTTGGIFGSTQANKPFGGFGQTSTSLTTQPAQTSSFSFSSGTAQPAAQGQSLFGAQTATQSPLSTAKPFGSSGFGSGLSTSLSTGFGQTQPAAGTTTGGIFGGSLSSPATQQKTGFGTTTGTGFGGFGTTTTTTPAAGTTGGIFGFGSTTTTPAQPSTGLSLTSTTPFGSTLGGSQTTTGLGGSAGFGTATGGGLFGSTTSTAQPTTTATTGGIFGAQQSTFGSPVTGFGTSTGLGTGLGTTTTTTPSTGLFGATTTQPTSQFGLGLGTSTTQPGSSFLSGSTGTSGGLFGSGGLTTSQTFSSSGGLGLGGGLVSQPSQPQLMGQLGQQQQTLAQAQEQPLVQQQLAALSNSPYGSHLLRSTLQDLGKKEDIFKPLSPIAQRPYITEATSPVKVTPIVSTSVSDIKGGLSQSLRLTPKPLNQISLNKKSNDLFQGLDEEETPCFVPRKNIKKLLFRPSANTSLGLDINTSRRSSANSSVNGDHKVDFMGRKSGVPDDSLRYNTDQNNDYKGNFMLGHMTADLTNVSDDGGAAADNQSEISTNHTPNPANVILDRPGYFIIPAIQELDKYVDAKGDCIVDNFAIGRVDYGCITFPGETNIANMNFDEIVHIRRKEVHVYPDDSKKPPEGQGLNKPAEITLHRIWPTDKETKKAITDPNRIINMGYNKKLEKITEDMGAQFIDYDPLTGSWTFKVKHFSKYGLSDSDEDEDDHIRKSKTTSIQQIRPIKPVYNETTPDIEFKQEKEMISKQLKLIEARRLELSKQAKYTNLNKLKNQQWDILNEYAIPTGTGPVSTNKISAARFDLSSDSQDIVNEDYLEDDDDKRSLHSNVDQLKRTSQQVQPLVRKDEQIDEEDELEDEDNKENSLYPNLTSLKSKNKSKTDKLYPNLNTFEPASEGFKYSNDSYPKNNLELDNKDYLKGLSSEMMMSEDQYRTSDLPFVVASSERMRSNRSLMKAFFSDDVDEFSIVDDDNKVRISSLLQKPSGQQSGQLGLIKKGLGGISNEELFEKKLSLKKESPFYAAQQHGQVKNITTMILNLADLQHRIENKSLKPKLWNRYLLQKTLKLGIQKPLDDQIRQTDQYDLEDGELAKYEYSRIQQMQPTRVSSEITTKSLSNIPFIKYSESITNKKQDLVADLALLHSHEFKINWAMYPTATTFINLELNLPQTSFNQLKLLSPSSVSITQLNESDKLNIIQENCIKYLQIQLHLTEFIESSKSNYSNVSKLPLLRSRPGNYLIKSFHECTEEIRNKIGDHPDADNIEHMKCVWSLCQHLWGDIPENYKIDQNSIDLNEYELQQIRKRLLSEWLADVSSHRVERQCKMHKFNKKKENYLDSMFCLLSGNRLLDACKMAADNSDYRLALLMSQSTGSSKTFRDMICKQVNEWLISGTNKFINSDRLKFYVLFSGNLVLNAYNNDEQLVNTCENLDWKRQFGLHLWYKCLPINSIHDALDYYEKSLSENICVKPLPPYLEDKVLTIPNEPISYQHQNTQQLPTNFQQSTLFRQFNQNKKQQQKEINDTCYHLIKLYCDENYSIADTIAPVTHNSNQLDFRLSWHLAMALVSLNYKYISNESLENLHDSYASQLQSIGLWHWSVFILMHIENDQEREKFVKNYISRYVTSESELSDKEAFLIEKLKVPAEWVYHFKAHRAKYECLHENQLKLLLKAHKWNEAHSVLIDILGPEFFLKKNFKTLNDYLSQLSKENQIINKWNLGGRVYLDAIKLYQNAQILFDFSKNESEKKTFDDEMIKQMHEQITVTSSRIKELKEFSNANPKKLLVCIQISKLLLKFLNVLIEINNDTETNQDNKVLTKQIVDKAFKATNSVPSHDLIQTMLMKKTKYSRDFIMSRGGF